MSQKTDILKYFSRFLYNSKLTFSPLSHKHSVSDIENLVEYTSEEKEKLKNIETGATRVIVDDTLLVSGRAADAKIVGDRIMQVEETVSEFKSIVAWRYCYSFVVAKLQIKITSKIMIVGFKTDCCAHKLTSNLLLA